MSKKYQIIIGCGKDDCYWNIGSEFKGKGNCARKDVHIIVDFSDCDNYIERKEAERRIALGMKQGDIEL